MHHANPTGLKHFQRFSRMHTSAGKLSGTEWCINMRYVTLKQPAVFKGLRVKIGISSRALLRASLRDPIKHVRDTPLTADLWSVVNQPTTFDSFNQLGVIKSHYKWFKALKKNGSQRRPGASLLIVSTVRRSSSRATHTVRVPLTSLFPFPKPEGYPFRL